MGGAIPPKLEEANVQEKQQQQQRRTWHGTSIAAPEIAATAEAIYTATIRFGWVGFSSVRLGGGCGEAVGVAGMDGGVHVSLAVTSRLSIRAVQCGGSGGGKGGRLGRRANVAR